MRNWEKVAGAIFAVLAVCIATWMVGSHFDLNKGEWASWVQAAGSIAAIAGAFLFGERQARANLTNAMLMEDEAARQRRDAYLTIVSAAIDHIFEIQEFFKDREPNKLALLLVYDDRKISRLVDAIGAVPLHDIGNSECVAAWITTHGALLTYQSQIERYWGALNGRRLQDHISAQADTDELITMATFVRAAANTVTTRYGRLAKCMRFS